jgi:hypothetical protein
MLYNKLISFVIKIVACGNTGSPLYMYLKGGNMNKALKSVIVLKFGTQDDFAARMGVSRSLVSNVIHGRRKLSFEKKVLWATHLKCSFYEIFPIDP